MELKLSFLWNFMDVVRFKRSNSKGTVTTYVDETTMHNGIVNFDHPTGRMWDAAAPGPIRRPVRNKNRQKAQKAARAKNRA